MFGSPQQPYHVYSVFLNLMSVLDNAIRDQHVSVVSSEPPLITPPKLPPQQKPKPDPMQEFRNLPTQQKIAGGCMLAVIGVSVLLGIGAIFGSSDDPELDARVAAQMWLEKHAHDASSVEIVHTEGIRAKNTGEILFLVRFRAKNAFGAKVIGQKLFLIREGQVVSATDFPQ